ncbi:MAG: helix-turn-helix transcriptional regulator [Planctomycetota bacterium]|jgi:AraC-like DNA-binding protein
MKNEFEIVLADSLQHYNSPVHPTPTWYELQLVEHADLYWRCGGRELRLKGRYFWVNQPRVRIEYGPTRLGRGWTHRFLVMRGRRCDLWAEQGLLPDQPQAIPASAMLKLGSLLDSVIAEQGEADPVMRLAAANRLESFLLTIHRLTGEARARPAWMDACLEELGREEGPPPDYDALARRFGTSTRSLQRQLRTHLGLSPHAYYLQCRIEGAKRLLLASDATLNLIAAQLGFRDEFTFIKTFKRLTGLPPGRFRRSMPPTL